jgi:hypothetical protein
MYNVHILFVRLAKSIKCSYGVGSAESSSEPECQITEPCLSKITTYTLTTTLLVAYFEFEFCYTNLKKELQRHTQLRIYNSSEMCCITATAVSFPLPNRQFTDCIFLHNCTFI